MKEFDEGFKHFIQDCTRNFDGSEGEYLGKKFVIGGGNPDSDILFIGMEPSQYSYFGTLERYMDNPAPDIWLREREQEIRYNEAKGLGFPKHWGRYRRSTVWYNYQLLYDFIKYGEERKHDTEMDFETGVFCTELSSFPQERHNSNNPETKANLVARKTDKFFGHEFFNRFKVIVLCALDHGYINNEKPFCEIERLFKVVWDKNTRSIESTGLKYWVHTGVIDGQKRILIHTRNLSNNSAIPRLVESIGTTVREFLR